MRIHSQRFINIISNIFSRLRKYLACSYVIFIIIVVGLYWHYFNISCFCRHYSIDVSFAHLINPLDVQCASTHQMPIGQINIKCNIEGLTIYEYSNNLKRSSPASKILFRLFGSLLYLPLVKSSSLSLIFHFVSDMYLYSLLLFLT